MKHSHDNGGNDTRGGISLARLVQFDWLPPICFFLWTGTYIWLLDTGNYRNFLQPKLLPFLIFGTVIFLALTLSWFMRRGVHLHKFSPAGHLVRSFIILVPLFYLGSSHDKSLTTHALEKRGLVRPETDVSDTNQEIDDDQPEIVTSGEMLNLLEVTRGLRSLQGKKVTTMGMVAQSEEIPRAYYVLFQFVISCCAADAQPAWVLLRPRQPLSTKESSWVQVAGELTISTINGKKYPVISPEYIKAIPPPPPGSRYLSRWGTKKLK